MWRQQWSFYCSLQLGGAPIPNASSFSQHSPQPAHSKCVKKKYLLPTVTDNSCLAIYAIFGNWYLLSFQKLGHLVSICYVKITVQTLENYNRCNEVSWQSHQEYTRYGCDSVTTWFGLFKFPSFSASEFSFGSVLWKITVLCQLVRLDSYLYYQSSNWRSY